MQNAIWLSWIVVTIALFVVRPRWGGLAYLGAVLLAPYGMFSGGDLSIRADLVLTPLMLACQILGISPTRKNASVIPIIWLFVSWLIWIGMVTLASDREPHFFSANGYIRVVMVMTIFSWIPWREKDGRDYQFAYVLTSIPIGILSVGQVANIPFLRALTEQWYSPPGATVIASQAEAEQAGHFYRAVGVFGNVSPTATYFLVVVCLTISLLGCAAMGARRSWLVLALAASIVGGMATLSSTFLGGILLALSVAFFYADSHHRRKLLAASTGGLAMLAIVVAFARSNIDSVDAVLDYHWQRITSGDFLAQRYSSNDGVLADAIDEFGQRPFTGVGWTQSETFSGDSIYMSLLYCSGITGCLPLLTGLARLTLAAFRNKTIGHWALSWTAIMLLGGIGCTSLISGRLADGWWAMQGMLISQLAATPRRHTVPLARTRTLPIRSIGARPSRVPRHGAGRPHTSTT